MQESVSRQFARLEPEKGARPNGLDQKFKERQRVHRANARQVMTVKTKKLSLKQRRTIGKPAYETLEAKENETEPEKSQVEKDEDGIAFWTGTH